MPSKSFVVGLCVFIVVLFVPSVLLNIWTFRDFIAHVYHEKVLPHLGILSLVSVCLVGIGIICLCSSRVVSALVMSVTLCAVIGCMYYFWIKPGVDLLPIEVPSGATTEPAMSGPPAISGHVPTPLEAALIGPPTEVAGLIFARESVHKKWIPSLSDEALKDYRKFQVWYKANSTIYVVIAEAESKKAEILAAMNYKEVEGGKVDLILDLPGHRTELEKRREYLGRIPIVP